MVRRVLLIDDDRAQFRLTHAQLAHCPREHFDLDWAGSYEEGLRKVLSGEYAACLLDYQLGPRDGLQLIREARAQGCHTPIVFLTSETSAAIDHAAMEAGALDYLVKQEITPRILERSLRYAVKLAESFDALRQLATHDDLTGVLNRREFDRLLKEEHDRAVRFGQPLSVLMIDVDQFKGVNDTHGHPAGDAVLQQLAGRMSHEVRSVDRIARYGGDEFTVILVQTVAAQALEVAERMRAAFATEPLVVAETVVVNLTISIGVAALAPGLNSPAALIAAADKALYTAKAAGRNRVMSASANG